MNFYENLRGDEKSGNRFYTTARQNAREKVVAVLRANRNEEKHQ